MKRRIHLIVHGKVQGINFRYETQFQAKNLGLSGWVKNLSDDTVEVLAEGEEEKLKELARWCSRGPMAATVNKVDAKWLDYKAEFKTFKITF